MDIKPKEVLAEYEGQKFSCNYDPNATTDKCWVWHVKFTRVYHFFGSGPTLNAAVKRARHKIHEMNHMVETMEQQREC